MRTPRDQPALTPTARLPQYQPIVDAMAAWLHRERLTTMMACERLYGRDSNGKVCGIGQVYSLLKGQHLPTQKTVDYLRNHRGPDLGDVVSAVKKGIAEHDKVREMTPVRAAVAAYETAEKAPAVMLEPRRRAAPAFALAIGDDGRASLDLHLADVDAEVALRCLEMLRAAGLLRKG